MAKLIDLAKVLRSKNAGPLWLTLDVMFDDSRKMEAVIASGKLTPEIVAKLYSTDPAYVTVTEYSVVNSIKITPPRRAVSGDIDDNDIYGCQQHLPLAGLEI